MKVRITKQGDVEKTLTFPILMKYSASVEDGELIILFTDDVTGVILVAEGDWGFNVGDVSDWAFSEFSPFEDVLTLSND